MPSFVNIALFCLVSPRLSVHNHAQFRLITGVYPNNNWDTCRILCIICHLDPILYGEGSPIIHS
ncbi:hypothetical protein EWM60_10065 [Candidatus Erwinia dacicola]|nr:hypothetical protein [Candidatus Erwinia dacicola]NJD85518.1 hypothetical protein [Candidatus Erwinia dacicola]